MKRAITTSIQMQPPGVGECSEFQYTVCKLLDKMEIQIMPNTLNISYEKDYENKQIKIYIEYED